MADKVLTDVKFEIVMYLDVYLVFELLVKLYYDIERTGSFVAFLSDKGSDLCTCLHGELSNTSRVCLLYFLFMAKCHEILF